MDWQKYVVLCSFFVACSTLFWGFFGGITWIQEVGLFLLWCAGIFLIRWETTGIQKNVLCSYVPTISIMAMFWVVLQGFFSGNVFGIVVFFVAVASLLWAIQRTPSWHLSRGVHVLHFKRRVNLFAMVVTVWIVYHFFFALQEVAVFFALTVFIVLLFLGNFLGGKKTNVLMHDILMLVAFFLWFVVGLWLFLGLVIVNAI